MPKVSKQEKTRTPSW